MAANINKPIIIFDFDGTVADSFLMALSVIFELAHHTPLPPEDVTVLRSLTVLQVLRKLDVPLWRAPLLARQIRAGLGKRMDVILPVPGILQAIAALSRQATLYMVSANDSNNLRAYLERHNMAKYFDGVYESWSPWAKAQVLRRLLRMHAGSEAWYVGDEPSDVRAAHAAGMRAAAVTWGFSNMHVLERVRPDVLVFTPEELVAAIGSKRK